LGRSFELAVCLEVAEHLPASASSTLVESLTEHAPVVLFSAAVPHSRGTHHVNEQWPQYWVEHFAKRNYEVVDCFRSRLWQDTSIDWWYAQDILLFVEHARLAG